MQVRCRDAGFTHQQDTVVHGFPLRRMRCGRVAVGEFTEGRRNHPPIPQEDATFVREADHLDEVAVAQVRRFLVGPDQQAVARGDIHLADDAHIESARVPRAEPHPTAVLKLDSEGLVVAPDHGQPLAFGIGPG